MFECTLPGKKKKRKEIKRVITKFKGKWWHLAVSRWVHGTMRVIWPFFLAQSRSPLRERSEKVEEVARRWRGERNISFKIMNSVSMPAAQRHLVLNNRIPSKPFSKSLHIYISKEGKNCFRFTYWEPPNPTHTFKGDFTFRSVFFLRVYLNIEWCQLWMFLKQIWR